MPPYSTPGFSLRCSLPVLCLALALPAARAADAQPPAAAKAALTVTAVSPREVDMPVRVSANGNIAAWQEASVGTETNGLRLAQVRVNVGDVVRKGQPLAVFAAETVQAELAESRANLAEAQARLAEAHANLLRAKDLYAQGFISPQKVTEQETLESTAAARVEALKAVLRSKEARLRQTTVTAPDDGVISARSATVGAVVPAGQELFRLIRQGRLEWRAEVAAHELARLQPGMAATLTPNGGTALTGKVRMIAPTVDTQTRNGLVYVDLPPQAGTRAGAAKAGMFARGEFSAGNSRALVLPQSAVLLREGFAYVMRIEAGSKVSSVKVSTGRRTQDQVEITAGLSATDQVVASGSAFLADGDTVRVVAQPPATPAKP